MSDDDNSNRTVFRPSPLQGLRNRTADQPGAQVAPTAEAFPETFPAQPQAEPEPPPRPIERLPDDDIPRPAIPPKVRNTMMDYAAAVLALAASVRSGRAQIALPQLHRQASAAVAEFERAIQRAGYPEESRQRAKYALCATLDDIAQNLPGQSADGAEWARRSLTVQFFSENIGGDRFWQLVDEMLSRPAQNKDLIELYHACLAAGFEGRFRVMGDGRRRLDEVMARLYAALEHVRSLSQVEIAAHWRGHPKAMSKVGFWAPLALAAGAALVGLFLVYLLLRFILMENGAQPANALAQINPQAPMTLSRAAPPAPPQTSAQLQSLQQCLAAQISAGQVTALQDAATVRVRTTIGALFASGSDQLNNGQPPLFATIAQCINGQPGPVAVEGHTDSDQIHTATFNDNMALSQARANTVAALIKSKLSDPSRVTTVGKGDTTPLVNNDSPQHKAQNRRVEVVLQRTQ